MRAIILVQSLQICIVDGHTHENVSYDGGHYDDLESRCRVVLNYYSESASCGVYEHISCDFIVAWENYEKRARAS